MLASASPRRALLIKKIPWLTATVFPCQADELPFTGGSAATYAQENAARKADWVFGHTGGTVLGADTVVTFGGAVYGKPKAASDADCLLHTLCGRTHSVITGYCIRTNEQRYVSSEETRVTFKAYDEAIIKAYVRSGAPFDKAGGYGLQDPLLAPLIVGVDGDEDNVIGLPVQAIGKAIKEILKWQ